MSYKGKYRPSYPEKYRGDYTNIVYRSLWELKFMKYCDSNENILEWGSEEIVLPYVSPLIIDITDTFLTFISRLKKEVVRLKNT